ncbi:MAG TPA: glycosyltransferase family 2 protein [Lachnospiraceae bacterium]|nr:glycosyltransferase family 2 protein [Lachnospiraceae bacterium]
MKLLTVTVPCYNSAEYMKKCIDSLLVGGEDVEIIIVNDGSIDETQKIGEEYVANYPSIVRLINKENGGHGSAVNVGIENAKGVYLKIVDSDDWVKESAFLAILEKLSDLVGGEKVIDMFVSNFVYEKVGEKRHKVMSYRHALPVDEVFSWNEVKHFNKGQYILMHSVIFRTKLLRDCGLKLPEHTFYVDNLYVFQPLPSVKNMYYLDVNFYRYFIGRDDQSVNESVMIGRIDQQIKVNKLMIDFFAQKNPKFMNKKIRNYMFNYLIIVTTVSSIMLIRSGTEENLEKKKELWEYIKNKDKYIYSKLRYCILGGSMNLPGRGGRKISVEGYKICQKIYKFN